MNGSAEGFPLLILILLVILLAFLANDCRKRARARLRLRIKIKREVPRRLNTYRGGGGLDSLSLASRFAAASLLRSTATLHHNHTPGPPEAKISTAPDSAVLPVMADCFRVKEWGWCRFCFRHRPILSSDPITTWRALRARRLSTQWCPPYPPGIYDCDRLFTSPPHIRNKSRPTLSA